MLFTNKKKPVAVEQTEDQPANYTTALEYLIGLSSDDYTKICHVAAIHRQADYESCQVLGIKCEPTTSIKQPQSEYQRLEDVKLEFEQLGEPKRKRKPAKAKK